MIRAIFIGLGLTAIAAAVVWPSDYDRLCVDGRSRVRAPGITYGGLPPRHGFERDHRWPLCGGGPDTADNVWYQPIDEARKKDELERDMCRSMCRGEITEDQLREYFQTDEWRKDLDR